MAGKGVIIEFDFAAMNGADLLYAVTKDFLAKLDGIALDERTEAKYLAGRSYLDGLGEYFALVKTKKTAAKAARDLSDAVGAALTAAAPAAFTVAFKNFVRAIVDQGVKVVLSTRADVEAVKPAFDAAFADLPEGRVVLYQDMTDNYGSATWLSWRRACASAGIRNTSAVAVAGSGFGVKAALVAGMGAMAVTCDHVAYQDFGGADVVVSELSGKTAKKLIGVLRL